LSVDSPRMSLLFSLKQIVYTVKNGMNVFTSWIALLGWWTLTLSGTGQWCWLDVWWYGVPGDDGTREGKLSIYTSICIQCSVGCITSGSVVWWCENVFRMDIN
jgi:hypothetical protein